MVLNPLCAQTTRRDRTKTYPAGLRGMLLSMKMTAIILLSACLTTSAKGLTQGVTISEKNAPIEKVFKAIEQQTGYVFFFDYSWLDKAKKVTIETKNVTLKEALNLCFKDQPLTYTIVDKTIVVKIKEVAIPNAPTTAEPVVIPPIDISGKVTDKDGNPLQGASITVKGKPNLGTKSGADGVFVLKGLNEDDVITISYAEHLDQSHKVGNTTSFLVKLERSEGNLQEVIINKGPYNEKMRNTVGNVAVVTAKDIEKSPVQNVLLAIQGRVTGMEITLRSGLNGGGVNVMIQGRNSIRSGLNPFIVIDGVPFANQLTNTTDAFPLETMLGGGSPLNYINPDDIESISILKDADATSLYGSRAANGAILITTKKGKAGKNKVSLNLQQGWGQVSRRVDMMNTQQYLGMRREALKNANLIASATSGAAAPFTYAPDLMIWDTTRYTDWQDILIGGTAKYTNINASVSGGSSVMQYRIGGTFNRTTTVFPGDFDDKRSSVQFNISNNAGAQRLKAELSGSYMFDNNKLPGIDLTQRAILLEPNAPALYKPDGTLNWAPNAAGSSTWTNPLSYLESSEFINTTKNLVANLNLGYRLAKGLDLQTKFGYTSLQGRIFIPFRIEALPPESRTAGARAAQFQNRNISGWTVDPQLNYQTQFQKAQIQALIATSIQKSDADVFGIVGRGFPSDQLMGTLLAATSTTISNSRTSTERYNALFGRFNFTWDNKYIFNFTARRDGSNKFGEKEKFNNFWSAGGAWIFSDEQGIQKALPFLSFGKLRASYGITGNDQFPPFSYLSTYLIQNPDILYQGGINLSNNGNANPNLKWEETRKLQAGLDIGLVQNRINLAFTYARNRSSNQLIDDFLPAMANGSIIRNHPATVQNTSLEFLLSSVNIRTKYLTWTTTANLTIPRNKLVSFPGIEKTIYNNNPSLGVVIGQPLGLLYVSRYAGVDPATGKFAAFDNRGNPRVNVGSFNSVFVDRNPKYYAGIVNAFTLGGFQLEFLIQLARKKGSRDMTWGTGSASWPGQFASSSSNQPITVLDHWQKPGDIAHAAIYHTSTVTNLVINTDAYYSYDAGSFARLKNVSLSWQMPKKWIPKNAFSSAHFYVHAQNLATSTKYNGIDPESGALGMPPLRMITVGANIEF